MAWTWSGCAGHSSHRWTAPASRSGSRHLRTSASPTPCSWHGTTSRSITAFETKYNLASATVIVYTLPGERRRPHFSFNLHAAGSSTIKNLSPQNQATALAVLRLLDVIDGEEAGA